MKQINRRVILRKRNRLSKEEIIEKSKIIKEKLFSSEEYKKAKTIMFYVSFGSEVYTHDMIREALEQNKIVVVPKVENDKLAICRIDDFNELGYENKYGIKEPEGLEKQVEKEKIDLVIVPGVAFDRRGYRIGYGKGYYDRFLTGLRAKTIGLCFSCQILDEVPYETGDVKLDKIINE